MSGDIKVEKEDNIQELKGTGGKEEGDILKPRNVSGGSVSTV